MDTIQLHAYGVVMESRTQQLQIRVTPSEKAAIREAAQHAGMDMSSWILARVLPRHRSQLRELVRELAASEHPMDQHAIWSELLELMDRIGAAEFEGAVDELVIDHLADVPANYLAALVELAAYRKGVRAPAWARRVKPLQEPWFGTTLSSLRTYLLRTAPVAFRRRNIFADAGVGDRV